MQRGLVSTEYICCQAATPAARSAEAAFLLAARSAEMNAETFADLAAELVAELRAELAAAAIQSSASKAASTTKNEREKAARRLRIENSLLSVDSENSRRPQRRRGTETRSMRVGKLRCQENVGCPGGQPIFIFNLQRLFVGEMATGHAGAMSAASHIGRLPATCHRRIGEYRPRSDGEQCSDSQCKCRSLFLHTILLRKQGPCCALMGAQSNFGIRKSSLIEKVATAMDGNCSNGKIITMRKSLRHLQVGHGIGLKKAAAGLGQPAGPIVGFGAARAVGGDAGAGIHLAIEL